MGNAKRGIVKKIFKIVGIALAAGLVLLVGFEIFTSIYFSPHDVRLTNVTDTSFTVSWVTNYPKRGVVYFKEKDDILPGILSWIGSEKAFDDRDIAYAQQRCVDEFNKEADVSEDFVVDTSNYDCDSVKVGRLGSYYTHHVTVTNLEPGREYYFRVGDGIVSWKRDVNSTYTFYSLTKEVREPSPIFGKITNENHEYVNDSIVYVKFINGYTKKESIYYSSVTADNGSWYLDGSNIRTIDGELMLVEAGQDVLEAHAQYKNFVLTKAYKWIYGDSNTAYPDIVVDDFAERDLSLGRKVNLGVFAEPPSRENPEEMEARTKAALEAAAAMGSVAKDSVGETEKKEEEPEAPQSRAGQNAPAPTKTNETPKTEFGVPSFITEEQKNALIAAANSGNVSEARKLGEVMGLGNASRILANQKKDPAITVDVLEKLGLAGDSTMSEDYRQSIIVGNMNVIDGFPNDLETRDTVCTGDSCQGKYAPVYITPGSPIKVGASIDNDINDNGEDSTFPTSLVGTIEIVIPVVNGERQISNNFVEWLIENNVTVSPVDCTDTQCKIVLDAVGFDVDKLLAYAVNKNDLPMIDSIITPLNSGIAELFKNKAVVALGTKGGRGEFIIKDSNLSFRGTEGLLGTDQVIVTDELKKIFPQLNGKKEISVSSLKSLIQARTVIMENYNNLVQETGNGETKYKGGSGEILMVAKNKDGTYTNSEKQPVICEDEKGCDCVYSDVTLRVGLNGTCITQEGLDSLRDPSKFEKSYPRTILDMWTSDQERIRRFLRYSEHESLLEELDDGSERSKEISNFIDSLSESTDLCRGSSLGFYRCLEYNMPPSTFKVVGDGLSNQETENGEIERVEEVDLKEKLKNLANDEESREELSRYLTNIKIAKENPNLGYYGNQVDALSLYIVEELDLSTEEDQKSRIPENVLTCTNENRMDDIQEMIDCLSEKDNIQGVSDTTISDTSSNSLGSGYITYLPEYGFFDLEIEGLVEGQKVEGGEGNLRVFYVEMNGKTGLQLPADPDNPQSGEDIVLKTNALNITYKRSAEVMTLNIKKGINLISFNYLPQIQANEYTKASDVILWLRSKGVRAENLSYFYAGRWQGVGYVGGEVTGNDFSITPGRGYLLYSLDDKQVNIPGYHLTSGVPISLSMGWNLVGIHGYSKVYTARSLLNSINKVEGLTANNISWWPTSKGKYEGLQLSDGKEYGFDFPISPNNGYFIRINKFEPKDTSCGSILWNEGGTHNGACGNSKTL